MSIIVSFYGNKTNDSCYIFKDCSGKEYLLNEKAHRVKGFNPFVYDKSPYLKNINLKSREFFGIDYIIQIRL